MTDFVLPAPPTDVDPVEIKCCCAEAWSHPMVRLLVGDAFRPGGIGQTADLLDRLDLRAGDLVLDVGSGAGATLRLLRGRGLAAVGVDYAAALAAEAAEHAPVAVGDAERLPFRSESFDAVLIECVLSALPDKPAALSGIRRVLHPGGRLGLSDVTLSGPGSYPELLSGLLSWLACTAGALDRDAYVALLEDHGFTVETVVDRHRDLRALVAKARRRFALLAGAVGTGILDGLDPSMLPGGETLPVDDPHALLHAGRQTLAQLAAAVDAGELGYIAVTATGP